MIRSNIVEMTQRQFDEAMGREAVEIEDFYTKEKYKVLFRKSSRGSKSNDSVIIFYPQDSNITKGTMFTLKGEKYLVMTKNSLESDVYFTSGAFRCNANVILYGGTDGASSTRNAGWYHKTPFVVNTFSGVNPSGSFIEVVNGNLNMSTSKQDYFTQINIGNDVLDFGGKFEIVNTFFLDGIQSIYLKKGLTNSNDKWIGLYDIGEVQVGDTVELHNVAVNLNNYVEYIEDVVCTYTVSNSSIAKIENGILTLLAEGTFTIGVSETGYTDYTSPTITVGKAQTPVDPSDPTELTWTFSDYNLNSTIYARTQYWSSVSITPSATTDKVPTWKLFFDDEEYTNNDLGDYLDIDLSNPYTYKFKVSSSVMAGYDLYIEAWVDGVNVGKSKTTHISQ